ncbi:hypothetical protein TDB9533_00851 [Thalassocella blandensis]|nr:hypothetical protein TDB9533_00851 [Thalassocella blandensis]
MKKDFYESNYKFSKLTDCMPVDLSRIAFVLKDFPHNDEDDRALEELPTKILIYLPEKNEAGSFGLLFWDSGLTDPKVSSGPKWVVLNSDFQVNEPVAKTEFYPIPNNEFGTLAKGQINIDGDVYAYGMIRSVFKRTDIKAWDNLTSESQHPNLWIDIKQKQERFFGSEVGFSALGGFNKNDLYAGGNRGDCWHYNGQQWRKVDLPLNSDISTIVCTPKGQVYIACRLGPVVVGRDNRWVTLDSFKEITHSAWFQNRIYFLSKDGRIYTLSDDTKSLIEAKFSSDYPNYMHHNIRGLASCDECLVIYTDIQAYAYDGKTWHEIVEIPSLSKHNINSTSP